MSKRPRINNTVCHTRVYCGTSISNQEVLTLGYTPKEPRVKTEFHGVDTDTIYHRRLEKRNGVSSIY